MLFSGEPTKIIDAQLAAFNAGGKALMHFAVAFDFEQYWLPAKPIKPLWGLYQFAATTSGIDISFTVTEQNKPWGELLAAMQGFTDFCNEHDLPLFRADQALRLQTVAIAKPWGQEIWYTGIEQRGVAELLASNQLAAPLPWVMAALPQQLCGDLARSLILLKILDPLPQPVTGDLYFELHEEKREVYVVTAVDKTAWPNGVGAIRFGFKAEKLAEYKDEAAFKQAFLQAVKAYEQVRRTLDEQPQASDDQTLCAKEQELRADMESFTEFLPLRVGDVVKVPCLTPHSLQHGVRTVEFQTPVYERLIVSFAQKVLTQDHWDTDKAVQLMSLAAEPASDFELLPQGSAGLGRGVRIERIVDFDDFEVRRYCLQPSQQTQLPANEQYALLMAIKGELLINDEILSAEQAVFLPKAWGGAVIENNSNEELCFLIAHPKVLF
ncbi:hypothetical protein NO559_04080 [Dasania sp. GY-MA-18]|uniref:Uncharacterized protein n=1 Tax=Dasania phycosphaerae TaxID=2950436 RepID=A0A9J6RJ02_9GAMM|nr:MULTISPECIES: hypothetical protein [Dasania]MCR8921934.1 hypothetical protein [Dasania sp. GY-MA-18]MCZ0864362.1 hypothetical protein [Dasania phycosphaerae]MCZ0868090.1 hypothetical protein [Dasania phycosphaerae]